MLEPAIAHKDELERLFALKIYDKDFYFYTGYLYCHEFPEIKPQDNVFQYAMLDSNKNVIGYLAYRIDPFTDTVYNFGLISFSEKPNVVIGKDLYTEMTKLLKHRRIEWRMIGINPIKKHYDKFCKAHGGYIVMLHDTCKDPDGNFCDSYIYEIITRRA